MTGETTSKIKSKPNPRSINLNLSQDSQVQSVKGEKLFSHDFNSISPNLSIRSEVKESALEFDYSLIKQVPRNPPPFFITNIILTARIKHLSEENQFLRQKLLSRIDLQVSL